MVHRYLISDMTDDFFQIPNLANGSDKDVPGI